MATTQTRTPSSPARSRKRFVTAGEITALYVRISDDDEGDALGVARQEKDMLGYAEGLGLPVRVFRDNSYSASRYARRKRPAYQEMLALIEAGEVRHVVFWDLSRLLRHPRDLEHLIDLAEVGTVEVHSMTGRIELRDPDGCAMARVVTAMNAKASDDTSKRIRRQKAQAREMGRYIGGGRRFGFEPKGSAVRDSEAALIREAADRILAGDGILTIVKDWNSRGLTAPLGGPFRRKVVRDALLRPETVAAGILSPETQLELRAVLDHPARKTTTTNARTHLLSGLLTCGRCGSRMNHHPNNGKAGYSCERSRHLSRQAKPVDEFVTDAVLFRLSGPGLSEALAQRSGDDPETQTLITALEGYGARLAALEDDYAEGGIDLPTFKRLRASIEARAEDTRAALARRSQSKVLTSLPAGDIAAWWPTGSLDRRRAVITALVESITVLPAGQGARHFDPSLVKISWKA